MGEEGPWGPAPFTTINGIFPNKSNTVVKIYTISFYFKKMSYFSEVTF